MNNSPLLVVVHGATGVGKTSVAIELASHLGCEIISCDSRQFYREMTIGTAVPSADELAAVTHHFIQDRSVHTPLSAGVYETEVLELLGKLHTITPIAILVGGTGLYAKAVTDGMDELPYSPDIRSDLNNKSLDDLVALLGLLDPYYYNIVDRANRARVQRAVEVCLAAGKPYSTLRTGQRKKRPFDILEIVLSRPREQLYERINQRVDTMITQGLIEEAQTLLPFRHLSALQTVGYRELFDHFDGKISLDQAVNLIKQNTRHYAKRQITWTNARTETHPMNAENIENIKKLILQYV